MLNLQHPWRQMAPLVLVMTLTSVAAIAQTELKRSVVASGGGSMGSTNYGVTGTVGQSAIGEQASSNYSVLGGYWLPEDNIATAIENRANLPRVYALDQNYPNPFNPATTIRFALPQESFVKLRVYDVSGNVVAELVNEVRQAGVHREDFVASSLASGIYFYRLEAKGFVQSRKLVLLK